MGKRKKAKRGKKDNDEKFSKPVMEKDTLPSPTLPKVESGTDSYLVSCPKSDYNITFTTRGENVIGTIYWKVGKFNDLEDGKHYVCHLPCLPANCCNVWDFVVQKSSTSISIILVCYINDRNVSFSVLLGDKIYKTSPLLTLEATEQVDGRYAVEFQFSTLERYKDELTHEFFTLKCQMMFYVSDLTRSEYPHSMCSCSNLTKHFDTLYANSDLSDITVEYTGSDFYSHRCILAARCLEFRKEFLTHPDTASTLHLPPLGMTAETFEHILQYIYTGTTVPLSVDTSISLFYISDLLGLPNLQIKCCHFLKMKLSKENFLKIYSLAVLTNSMHLKTATEVFFLEHKDLMESLNPDDFEDLNAPPFVTNKEFNSFKASLKQLFQRVQRLQAETIHDVQWFAERIFRCFGR